ncbi:F-box/kelch-repeat protein At1g15670-like isoform X2 [Curcuma longa]|uniref:F-box/kelch-repeat protein At1g15670-like isoform X2 n=1 Tax=Curcuma longa TaxID=136217 RepID=UPI003D9F3684
MKRSRARRSMAMEAELIPGLLDCLALECLLRLPFHAILNARTVCKRWKHEFDSPSFYRIRRAAGLGPRVVMLLLRGKVPHTRGKFHLALYEPDTDVCIMRQLAPDRPMMRPLTPDLVDLGMGFSSAAVIGRELLVIGGCDAREDRCTGEVNFYDLISGAWRPGAPNPAPDRYLYRKVVNGGKMLFIGGYDDEKKKLQSALVYDVATDIWLEIPDLGQGTWQGPSIDGGKFCDKFWESKEEYNTVIRRCREMLLLVDEDDDLRFCLTEGDKEKQRYDEGPDDADFLEKQNAFSPCRVRRRERT